MSAAEDHLFDPGPAQERKGNRYRPGDRDLYVPPQVRNARYDRHRNIEVRAKLQAHFEDRLPAKLAAMGLAPHVRGASKRAWGKLRGDFARDWVAEAEVDTSLVIPGTSRPTKAHTAKGAEGRKVDSARTMLRQFMEGKDQPDWVLVGIVCTVAARTGEAPPPRNQQGFLV